MMKRRSIKYYGARPNGDPVGHCFRDAAEDMRSKGGGEVTYGPGDYNLSDAAGGIEINGPRQNWTGHGAPRLDFAGQQGFHFNGGIHQFAMVNTGILNAATGALFVKSANSDHTEFTYFELDRMTFRHCASAVSLQGKFISHARMTRGSIFDMDGAYGLAFGQKNNRGGDIFISQWDIEKITGTGSVYGYIGDGDDVHVTDVTIRDVTGGEDQQCDGFYFRGTNGTVKGLNLHSAGTTQSMNIKGKDDSGGHTLSDILITGGPVSANLIAVHVDDVRITNLIARDTVQKGNHPYSSVMEAINGAERVTVADSEFRNCKDTNGNPLQWNQFGNVIDSGGVAESWS